MAGSKRDAQGWTDKERLFVDEYMIDLNQTQAAIRAGYSPKSAKTIASQLMKREHIAEEVEKRKARKSARCGISEERVLRELGMIGFQNANDIIDPATGWIRDGINPEEMACVSSVKKKVMTGKNSGEEMEIKFWDKNKALENLGKHYGLFNDKIQLLGDEKGFEININYGGELPKDDSFPEEDKPTEE